VVQGSSQEKNNQSSDERPTMTISSTTPPPNNHEEEEEYDKSTFNHVFSGWSIWIEPEECEVLQKEMTYLQKTCGGPYVDDRGVHPFVPHVTVLYNLQTKPDVDATDPEQLLQKCWKQLQQRLQHTESMSSSSSYSSSSSSLKNETSTTTTSSIGDQVIKTKDENGLSSIKFPLNLTDWYSFLYPKDADGGHGFGCSIALLLVEPTTKWLVELHRACRQVFGNDERGARCFVPHLSCVYAPESCEELLQEYTKRQIRDQILIKSSLNARYLSLWSTEGTMDQWHRIAKIAI
jgi:2'-5' RNA ligase